jgi:hypothetical protein
MASETGDLNRPKSSPTAARATGCAPQSSPYPPGLELAGDLRGVMTLVPLVHLPVSLAGPEPSGSAGPSRRCRGCLPPSPASPGSGCPQLRYAAATAQRCRSFTSTRSHSASWRSVGRAEARYRDCSRSVSSTRPPHRTSVFPRIRRSTSSQGQAAAGVAVVLVHGVGMLLARQR